jgi:hypothetical protein
MAISTGKNNKNTGVNRVPNPNPEKKVNAEASKATIETITISIIKKLDTKKM